MIVKLYSNNNSPESGWNKKGEKYTYSIQILIQEKRRKLVRKNI